MNERRSTGRPLLQECGTTGTKKPSCPVESNAERLRVRLVRAANAKKALIGRMEEPAGTLVVGLRRPSIARESYRWL